MQRPQGREDKAAGRDDCDVTFERAKEWNLVAVSS